MTDLAGAGQPHLHHAVLPVLSGMSDVTVHAAHLTIEAVSYTETRAVVPIAQTHGVLVDLGEESRLVGFVLASPLDANHHLVIAAPDGTVLFSDRASASPQLPGGMSLDADRKRATFPALVGSSWMIDIRDAAVSVTDVILEQLPHDLTVAAREDGQLQILAMHGGVLTPEQGKQDVDFRALAERLMMKRPAPRLFLEITSRTPARIKLTQPPIEARYETRPEEPMRVNVRGEWEPLPLTPPLLRPIAATLRMTAKHLGRDRNAAPLVKKPPCGGLRIDRTCAGAALAAFQPLPGSPIGTLLALASIRISMLAFEASELAVELRKNESGSPGELLAPHVVRAIDAGTNGWIEIEWPEPPAIATGNAAVWIAIRATRGSVLWNADPASDATRAMISTDNGSHWAPLDLRLASPLAPRVQLFHSVIVPDAVPIELIVDGTTSQSWALQRVDAESLEFTARVSLPPRMLPRLAFTPELALRSASALDVRVDEVVLSYDPAHV
jgi:hypothetical protein